ncbi:hypothetical protein KA529_04655 [Candidatus Saccharibacteria bacterium]|nr:hypothetical protein [Candidatus Saccharibacteria bacterium]
MTDKERKDITEHVAGLYKEHFDDTLAVILEKIDSTMTKQDGQRIEEKIELVNNRTKDIETVFEDHSKQLQNLHTSPA